MSDDYLWDKSGAPDPEVEELEQQLGAFRHDEPFRHRADPAPAAEGRRFGEHTGAIFLAAAVILIGIGYMGWLSMKGSDGKPTLAGRHPPDAALPDQLLVACTADPGTPSWGVTTVSGAPSCGAGVLGDRLPMGDWLETDADSTAEIEVADIGRVIVESRSRVRLVATGAEQHRLELARGKIHASVYAPPRLFVVDTPSATAIDLGCEYTLEVADSGAAHLQVRSGYVLMVRDGVEAYVPEGFAVETDPDKGVGLPYRSDATGDLIMAVKKYLRVADNAHYFDEILAAARPADIHTLKQLEERVEGAQRERVAERLVVLLIMEKATQPIETWRLQRPRKKQR